MGTKKNKTVIDKLDNVELEILQQNTEYAKQLLTEEGMNVADEVAYADQHIKKIKFLAQASANKSRDKTLIETALIRIKDAIRDNANRTTEALAALLQSKTPSVQYRKLENWTDDEIREVLADVDLVKLMEEIEKGNL